MNITFLITESIQALRANIMRSILTIVGIVVGIFSVTAMLAIGNGVSQGILDKFNAFSSGDISIQGELLINDYQWLANQKYTKNITAEISIQKASVLVGENEYAPNVISVIGDFVETKPFKTISGEIYNFNDLNFTERSVILSKNFMETLNKDGSKLKVGNQIRIKGQNFTVVAITDISSSFGRGDGDIYIPYASMVRNLSSKPYFSDISISLKDQTTYEVVSKHILESLTNKRGLKEIDEEKLSVLSSQEFIENAQDTTKMLNLFLAFVGSIALFIGGVGTMNMMLTTVTERTREIGLRKAVGAHNRDILMQILFESIIMTFTGGLIGIGLTYIGSAIATKVLAEDSMIQVILSGNILIISVIVSIIIGVIFGYYPAKNAAKLQPVDALRSE